MYKMAWHGLVLHNGAVCITGLRSISNSIPSVCSYSVCVYAFASVL